MRIYEPLWNELKNKGRCKVAAPRELHPRIIKAVKKEKYNDLAFKLMMYESGKIREIRFFTNGDMIVFSLKEIGTITQICLEQL